MRLAVSVAVVHYRDWAIVAGTLLAAGAGVWLALVTRGLATSTSQLVRQSALTEEEHLRREGLERVLEGIDSLLAAAIASLGTPGHEHYAAFLGARARLRTTLAAVNADPYLHQSELLLRCDQKETEGQAEAAILEATERLNQNPMKGRVPEMPKSGWQ